MGQGIDVEPETLAQHGANIASVVGGVVKECRAAADMAEGGGFNESYGAIISPIAVPAMELVTWNAKSAMDAAIGFNDALAEAVAGTAAVYDSIDSAIAEDFDKIAEAME
ncbi:type VII secretion target [Glycomyces sp. L485]|uniref:type VII secretion target n=1 Tax=Glycomyces sp. L485 TaxID=2909235 RepID=UPI001F4B4DB0|nr:type VII secretion target [Glycomyces sp. L485]MCH7229351.1 type VII secretion target [Glycomyces sp. L485]